MGERIEDCEANTIGPECHDGRRISALFDTGAQFSILSTRTALALGVSEAVLARDPAVTLCGADGEQLSAHAHRFFRLEVDGEVIRNAEIDVTEISLNDAEFVLGFDFLGSRRIWISYGIRSGIHRRSF